MAAVGQVGARSRTAQPAIRPRPPGCRVSNRAVVRVQADHQLPDRPPAECAVLAAQVEESVLHPAEALLLSGEWQLWDGAGWPAPGRRGTRPACPSMSRRDLGRSQQPVVALDGRHGRRREFSLMVMNWLTYSRLPALSPGPSADLPMPPKGRRRTMAPVVPRLMHSCRQRSAQPAVLLAVVEAFQAAGQVAAGLAGLSMA